LDIAISRHHFNAALRLLTEARPAAATPAAPPARWLTHLHPERQLAKRPSDEDTIHTRGQVQ
jgi:hypothetical protein